MVTQLHSCEGIIVGSHEDLKVWQDAMDLVEEVYMLTLKFPKEEIYGLSSQVRRAALSIPSNIAEGAGRSGKAELIRFLYIAQGSLSELETQLKIAQRLNYVDNELLPFNRILFIRKMISNLIKSLK